MARTESLQCCPDLVERLLPKPSRVMVALSRAQQTVASARVGWPFCGGLGVGSACPGVGAPGFGSRVCRVVGLVVSVAVRRCRVSSLEVLGGWVRALWKTVAADGCARPSVFVTLGFLLENRRKNGCGGSYECCPGGAAAGDGHRGVMDW